MKKIIRKTISNCFSDTKENFSENNLKYLHESNSVIILGELSNEKVCLFWRVYIRLNTYQKHFKTVQKRKLTLLQWKMLCAYHEIRKQKERLDKKMLILCEILFLTWPGILILSGVMITFQVMLFKENKRYNSKSADKRFEDKVKIIIINNEFNQPGKLEEKDFVFFINYMNKKYRVRNGDDQKIKQKFNWINWMLVLSYFLALIIILAFIHSTWLSIVYKAIVPSGFLSLCLILINGFQKIFALKFSTEEGTNEIYNHHQFNLILKDYKDWWQENSNQKINGLTKEIYDEKRLELWIYVLIKTVKKLKIETANIHDSTFSKNKKETQIKELTKKLDNLKFQLNYSLEGNIEILLSIFDSIKDVS